MRVNELFSDIEKIRKRVIVLGITLKILFYFQKMLRLH
jgi:hypothetical protein